MLTELPCYMGSTLSLLLVVSGTCFVCYAGCSSSLKTRRQKLGEQNSLGLSIKMVLQHYLFLLGPFHTVGQDMSIVVNRWGPTDLESLGISWVGEKSEVMEYFGVIVLEFLRVLPRFVTV